ncbi:MAG: flagellar hook-basal body complex protein [Firmicutes bacterium]|nr:flagellar hook-basal body complex protein [Bacillota bacterium]
MMRSMFAGVTGLRNHQIRMDAIGNNIANVNTVGYKAGRVSFQDTLNQTLRGASAPNANRGGINALQVGLGMNLASIDVLHTQGNLQNTGKITDVAIQGDGFFILSDGQREYYTRAGNFNMERDGRLVNPSNGLIVRGWMANITGVINTNMPVTNIRIPVGQTIAPIATSQIEFGGNLAANTNVNLRYMTQSVSDASNDHSATITYTLRPVGFNEYEYEAVVQGGTITGGSGYHGTIRLNENGVVVASPGTWFEVTPTDGTPVRIMSPQVGQLMGDGFEAHYTGALQSNVLTGFTGTVPFNYDATLIDTAGNTVNLTYQITGTSIPNRFQWQIVPDSDPGPENVTIEQGGMGTFEWDSTRGIYNASDVTTLVRSTAPSGVNITINPPSEMSGIPTFTVVERAPEVIAAGTVNMPAFAGAGTYTYNLNNAAGEVLSHLQFNVTGPVAGVYSWTLNAENGSVLTGGSGTFTWGPPTAGVTGDPTRIRLENGVEVTFGAMQNGVNPPSFEEGLMVGGQDGQVQIRVPEPVVTMTRVYDSLGNDHLLLTTATKMDDNNWIWSTVDEYENPIGSGRINFSNEGELISYTGGPITFTPPGALPVRINPDFSDLSQYAGTLDSDNMAISDFTSPFQDGYPMGMLQGFNIDKSGRIVGVFSNGMNQNLAQLAVASFTNPGGLSRVGDTMFEESSNSGQPQVGQAGQGSRGQITPGTVEMSNVDLSQEFTDMIMTERGFQSNSRVITTSDEMLQELVNLKR